MLLRKLLSDCRWPTREESHEVAVHQQLQLPRRRSLVLHSISETTLNSTLKDDSLQSSLVCKDTQFGASSSQKTDSISKRRAVPVLFSTNRGLYLRVPKKTFASYDESPKESSLASNYNISFCDLERWSTNRAYTISLEDTFTIARSPPQAFDVDSPPQPLELFVPNRRTCFNQNINNNQFMPIKRAVRFYNAFSRFETRY